MGSDNHFIYAPQDRLELNNGRENFQTSHSTHVEGIVGGSYALPVTVPTVLGDDNLAIHTYVHEAVSGDTAGVCDGSSGCNGGTFATGTSVVKQCSGEGVVVTPRASCCTSAAERYSMYEYDSDAASEDSHATLEDVYRLQVPGGGPDDGAGSLSALKADCCGDDGTVVPQAPPSARLGGGLRSLR